MKILVLCDQGNNRSVTIMHHLRYWGHDVLSAGLATNDPLTLSMLMNWADRVITTDTSQSERHAITSDKLQLWDVGPDKYPRPFNKDLLVKVRLLMEQHKDEYKTQT